MTDTALTAAREAALEAQAKIREANDTLAITIKEALSQGAKALFDKYPFLHSIAWSQYTPFFNDGDPCVFSSTLGDVSLNSITDEEEGIGQVTGYEHGEHFDSLCCAEKYVGREATGTDNPYVPNEKADPQYIACNKEAKEFISSLIGDEKRNYSSDEPTTFDKALLAAFGNHCTVEINRGGFEVDEYQHD